MGFLLGVALSAVEPFPAWRITEISARWLCESHIFVGEMTRGSWGGDRRGMVGMVADEGRVQQGERMATWALRTCLLLNFRNSLSFVHE